LQELVPITPVNFFQLGADLRYLEGKLAFPRLNTHSFKEYLLPDTSMLCNEESFADVALGWNEMGLECFAKINHPVERCHYPDVTRGDSFELFIDTRDVKTSGHNTRFCHHFFYLPEAVEGVQAGEMTHFRTEDRHELCDSSRLAFKINKRSSGYDLQAFIPKECLVGYDPEQFQKMGFSYRVNRNHFVSQHFSVVTEDYKLEEQPSLWSQLRLVK
jgi:hypothetical protein